MRIAGAGGGGTFPDGEWTPANGATTNTTNTPSDLSLPQTLTAGVLNSDPLHHIKLTHSYGTLRLFINGTHYGDFNCGTANYPFQPGYDRGTYYLFGSATGGASQTGQNTTEEEEQFDFRLYSMAIALGREDVLNPAFSV